MGEERSIESFSSPLLRSKDINVARSSAAASISAGVQVSTLPRTSSFQTSERFARAQACPRAVAFDWLRWFPSPFHHLHLLGPKPDHVKVLRCDRINAEFGQPYALFEERLSQDLES